MKEARVHFNDPGRADWEGIETGSRALAAGGGTMFFDMPLNAHPPNVSTLVCRCMPAQARNLLATQTYELRPGWESKGRPAFGPTNGAARLEQSLRLPQSF